MRILPLFRLMTALLCLAFAGGEASAVPNPQAPAALPQASGEAPAIAAAIAVTGDAARTSFAITLSKPVTAHASVMERPDRVILDLPEVAFHVPADTGRKREGVVSSFRYGLFAPGRSRVVIDLVQPALVSRIELKANPDGTAILAVELTKAEREAFRRAAADSARAAKTAIAAPPPDPVQDRRPVIMLDPGHGGIDPGATAADGSFEKDIVFSFAQELRRKLEAEGRYRVLMTREKDAFVPLGERVRIARNAKADLFISIHADSISGAGEVRGLTVYTGSERASDAESARLADRENRADAVAGIDSSAASEEISDILQDLTQRETRAFSHGFATRLVGELEPVARMNKNPHRQAGFRVLRAHDIPSVLVELGYLSSRQDFDQLMSQAWREKATGAMTAAINRFFATRLANQAPAPVSP